MFSDPNMNMRLLDTMRGYTAALEGLRAAAASQQAMLGLLGPQRQQQQWNQQQHAGGSDFAEAVGKAAYALLRLRLLAPSVVPQMKPAARVLVLK